MDKIAIVTGATSGIGKAIALGLARKGFRVGIVCRNRTRGEAAAAELAGSVPGAEAEIFLADLSVLQDVRRVAGELRERYPRVDVLVDNAGAHLLRAKVSADGYDRMVATNHLGPFLLTNRLLGVLDETARIVVVASEAHRFADPFEAGGPGRARPLRVRPDRCACTAGPSSSTCSSRRSWPSG